MPLIRCFSTPSVKLESVADEDVLNEIKQTLESSYVPEHDESPLLMLPRNINSFKLGKLLGVEPMKIFETVIDLTNDICTDEFQILSEEAI